jgi:hypothetical protein
MIVKIRDYEISDISLKTPLTVHQGLSRLQTNDAACASGEEASERAAKQNGVAARNAFVCAAGPISKRSRRTFAARHHTTA